MRLSLRSREVLAVTAVALLVVAVTTAAQLAAVTRIALRSASDEGTFVARQLFHQSARVVAASRQPPPIALRRDPGVRALLDGIVGYSPTIVYAAIVDPAGRAVVHSIPALEDARLPPRENIETVVGASALATVATLFGEPRVYEALLPLQFGDRPFGAVRVGLSTSLIRRELTPTLVQSLALAAGAIVIAVLAGLGVGTMLLRSIRRIAEGMERLVRGQYDATVELTGDDELGELAARVNRLGEQIQADQSQWQSERAQLAGIINTLEDAVIVLDPGRRVVFCNSAAEDVLGRRLDDVAGFTLDAVLPADHPLLGVIGDLFEAGQECRSTPLKVPRGDGGTREVAVSSYRIDEGAHAGAGVLALKDLDPVRAVQSLVSYSQKLAALGHLTAGVAHEVRNPLNAMRIHVELLRTRLGEPRPEVSEPLDVLVGEIQRLDRVVQGFLKFARPQDLRLARVDVNALLADAARLSTPEAVEAGCTVALDLEPGLPTVIADPELLEQALTNLVVNAIQAMPNGGTVTLASRAGAPGTMEIRVSDEGVGIRPENLERIFRLYYTTKPNGSGIGLSLVYRIVQMHDGRVDVESTVGRGTTVTITLPPARGLA